MEIEITPLSNVLGAEVVGLDLSKRLSDAEFARVEQAFHDHSVLVFRRQSLTPDEHVAFSARFGPLLSHVMSQFLLPGHPEILRISNLKLDGTPLGFEDAGRYWHTDVSYAEIPPLGSMLYALEIPPEGGDTLYANMYMAYETLPEATKDRVQGLRALHRYNYGERQKDNPLREEMSAEQKAQLKTASHPIVRSHPGSGRQALYVNPGFTVAIEGLPEAEGTRLLAELLAHVQQPEFVYRHRWQDNDLVFWDNRCAMHQATNYAAKHRRHMHRTTIEGERPV